VRERSAGGGRLLHNKQLHDLCSSPNIRILIEEDEMGRECSTHDKGGKCIEHLTGKREETTWETLA
jgi:hypothetical protein